jgi:hypothetical protein
MFGVTQYKNGHQIIKIDSTKNQKRYHEEKIHQTVLEIFGDRSESDVGPPSYGVRLKMLIIKQLDLSDTLIGSGNSHSESIDHLLKSPH